MALTEKELRLTLITPDDRGEWDIVVESYFYENTTLRAAITLAYCGGEYDPNDVRMEEIPGLDEVLLFHLQTPHPYPYIMIDGFEYKFYIEDDLST